MPNEEAEKKGHDAGDHSHCSHAHEHDEHGHCGHDHAAHAHDAHGHSHDAHGHSHDSHAHGHDDHGHGGHGGFVPPNSIHDHTLVAVCLVTLAGLIWLIGYWSTCSFTAHATAAEHQSAPGADEGQTPGPGHEEQTSGTTGEGAEHH